jgi:hypothetical protein
VGVRPKEHLIRLSCLRQFASGACRADNREHLRAYLRYNERTV